MDSFAQAGVLAGAGLLAGAVNALAGGGTLISFPVMLATGYPPLTATVTSTVALWPGYLGSVLGYRAELRGGRRQLALLGGTAVLGALAGSVLLLVTSEALFASLVPALIGLASLALLLQPWLKARLGLGGSEDGEKPAQSGLVYPGVLLGGTYGGYFAGGMGVLLLGVLGLFVHDELQRVNAVRSALQLAISSVAVLTFGIFGPVHWPAVAVMAVASLIGGFLGVRVARLMSPAVLRGVVVAFGFTVAVILAAQ